MLSGILVKIKAMRIENSFRLESLPSKFFSLNAEGNMF